jgi:tRNA pseudouridine32 synthase/23S rRNA pseudouridine746 synthase
VARYRLHPHTGRKHQLRLHMASLGVPILNDAFYPVALPCKGDDFSAPLQLLARSIHFDDPLTGEARSFESTRELDWPAR